MGLSSDILETNRERMQYDPCLIYTGDACSYPSTHFSQARQVATEKSVYDQESILYIVFEKNRQLSNAMHLKARCIYREKQLLFYKRAFSIKSYIVSDTLNQYIVAVQENLRYTSEIISSLQVVPSQEDFDQIDEVNELRISLSVLIDSVFYFLEAGTPIDSSMTHKVFSDLAQMIIALRGAGDTDNRKAKEICKDYYVSTHVVTHGINRCRNCGEPLFQEFPYCFNCFERSE